MDTDRKGTSLYIRPFVIATEPSLGVRPSKRYKFMVVLTPVGSYYGDQLKPIRIYVEDEYVRAVTGGVGDVKTSGNYAASLQAQRKAEELGYDQVLWLDGVEKICRRGREYEYLFHHKRRGRNAGVKRKHSRGITRASVIELLKAGASVSGKNRSPLMTSMRLQ